MTPPRVLAAAGVSAGGNPGKGSSGRPPLIRPCGATFPRGGRQELLLASGTPPPTVCPGKGGGGRSRRGGGTPPYGWGYGNAVGFTWAPVSGPPHGRGRACPARGGLRGHPSMVRPVGRDLDPSAGGYLGMGVGGRFRGASGTPPLRFARGMGGDGRPRRGGGTPPYGWGYGNARGVYADTRFRAAAR